MSLWRGVLSLREDGKNKECLSDGEGKTKSALLLPRDMNADRCEADTDFTLKNNVTPGYRTYPGQRDAPNTSQIHLAVTENLDEPL